MRVTVPVTIAPNATFSRASTKQVIGPDGLLMTVPVNVLALQYDPANLSAAPVVVLEGAGTNVLLSSDQFSSAAWSGVAFAITENYAIAPDGTMTADRIQFSGPNQAWSQWSSITAGTVCSGSVFVKGVSGQTIATAPGGVDQVFTLDGTWQWLKAENKTALNSSFNVNTYNGATARDIQVWRAQLETGPVCTSPVQTATTPVTRAADIITGTGLAYSSLAEPSPGEVAHNLTASYLTGNEVISTATHKKYKSLQGAASLVTLSIASPCVLTWPAHELVSGDPVAITTTGALPTGLTASTTYYAIVTGSDTLNLAATAGGAAIVTSGTQSGAHTAMSNANKGRALPVAPITTTDWWIESGVTNRMAAFDLKRNTQSVGTSPLAFLFAPGERVNTIGVLGMDGDSITVSATSGGVSVYSYTENLIIREVLDHYQYAFKPFSRRASIVKFDLPPFTDLVIAVTITRATGPVKCGSIIVGTYAYIGAAQYSAESDALNFSKVTRDDFGELSELVVRRSVPKVSAQLMLEKERVNDVYDVRKSLNAVPALWTGLDDATDGYFDMLLILGIYKQFKINATYPTHAAVNLEIEEL